MSSKIPLTRGQFAIVDDRDVALLSQHSWHSDPCYNGSYRVRGWVNGKVVLMHRFLLGYPNSEIDHKNLNPLDNRRCNLRVCTGTQNHGNSAVRASKSGYKGVYYRSSSHKRNLCWEAQIQFQRCRYFLGLFETPEEAATSYGLHALAAFGEFARIS